VKRYRLKSNPIVDADVEAAFQWYESEKEGLGYEFLDELRRIRNGPLKYQVLSSGIRRAMTRRFPYAIYFLVEGTLIVILAVLHAGRDPAVWQRRIE
jgi:plasmid stabilization system protein ParE